MEENMRIIIKREKHKGFSLLEVLLAITLLAIIATPIIQLIYSTLAMNTTSRKMMGANDASQAVMEYVTSLTYNKIDTDFSSNITLPGSSYSGTPSSIPSSSIYNNYRPISGFTKTYLLKNVVYGGYHYNICIYFEPVNESDDYFVYLVYVDTYLADNSSPFDPVSTKPIAELQGSVFNNL